MNKKVLLKDAAKHIGVSTALVSYVINNKGKKARVGPEMEKNSQGSPGFELSAESYRQEFKKWQNKRNWINGGRYLQSFLFKSVPYIPMA